MKPLVRRSRNTQFLALFLSSFILFILFLISLSFQPVGALPAAQATPTCPPPPPACPQPRVYSRQPWRYYIRSTFNDAASNSLGDKAPTYDLINRGIPPNMKQYATHPSRYIKGDRMAGVTLASVC